MDSITQATIGAAVGHAVLGEKMGNRAVLVGAIAGTIPDFDMVMKLITEHAVYGLTYHRGLTHSILFALVVPPILAWLSLLYYKKDLHKNKKVQLGLAIWWSLFYAAIVVAIGVAAYKAGSAALWVIAGLFLVGGYVLYRTLQRSVEKRQFKDYDPSFWHWTLMYALAFVTHSLIDTCTPYGTQVFEPFSSMRITFSNISIIDPLFTVPMLVGLIGVLLAREYPVERRWNRVGMGIAVVYLGITFAIKAHVNKVVERSMASQGISPENYTTYPTFLNSVLWQTTIRAKDAYYYGTYSLIDRPSDIEFLKLPNNPELLGPYEDHEFICILKWFSNGYYNVTKNEDGTLTFNNLRFGLYGDPGGENSVPTKERYVFRFIIKETEDGLEVKPDKKYTKEKAKWVARAIVGRTIGY